MAKQDRAIATLDKIVLGAANIFYEVGYDGASITNIAEAGGVTKGALYFHFQSKEDIARAVIEKEHEIASASAKKILEKTDSPVETMMRMCADLARLLRTEPLVRAGIRLTTAGSIFEPPTRAPYEDWLQKFEALARKGIAAGELSKSTDPEKLAHFIIPSFTGVQMVSDVLTGRADLHQRVREMWEILLPSIIVPEQLQGFQRRLAEIFPR